MFTVGLFTTHIPYIAFVFFYAFFFLFGYQKLADENFPTEEKSGVHTLVYNLDNQFSNNNVNFDFSDSSITNSPENGWLVNPDRKTELLIPPEKSFQQEDFNLFYFSRPPPAA